MRDMRAHKVMLMLRRPRRDRGYQTRSFERDANRGRPAR